MSGLHVLSMESYALSPDCLRGSMSVGLWGTDQIMEVIFATNPFSWNSCISIALQLFTNSCSLTMIFSLLLNRIDTAGLCLLVEGHGNLPAHC